ncbi:hypothetical protein JMJ35_009474 [Cladonia borealis]|uniref:RNase III domain-containing protein n=1 Tax=Cladonia borealis TaxID=184061 RepID=A0AA39QSK2_9LECA|nr:hypothetical protein JMJ35_009474 [Cladonia borealis]
MGSKRSHEPDVQSGETSSKKLASTNNLLKLQSGDAKVPSYLTLRKATSEPSPYLGNPSTLPPLPEIRDKSLVSTLFTHPGTLNGHSSTKVDTSYDRLELLGDAYIEIIATRLVFSRFPKMPAGRLSQQRELLVKNETLAEYALAYNFDEKGQLPTSMKQGGKDSKKKWTKTMGDMFEAYVAAIVLSDPTDGFETAEGWLRLLWENKLAKQPTIETQTADPNAKVQLANKVMGKDIKLHYRDEAPPQELRKEGKLIFQIGVYLTGWGWENTRLGTGKGLSKQEAGAKAAADALVNPLTAQVASVKIRFNDLKLLEKNRVKDETEAS